MKRPMSNPHQHIINDLLQMASYLTDNPDLPMPSDVEVRWLVGGSDSDRIAKVREMARWWNVDQAWDEPGRTVWAHWRFSRISWAVIAELMPPAIAAVPAPEPAAVDVDQAVPEVDCPACRGTGIEYAEREGGTCPHCLGRGRLPAPWLPPAEAGASAW